MSDLITRTARLVPYAKRPKQVPSFVTAYAYEPLANENGAEFGSMYVVTEVLVSGRASEEVADLIIETIGEKYYNDPAADSDPLGRFEAAIKATNQELGEHVNRGNAAWIGKLSAVVAIQIGEELHVSQTGSAEAFLYRRKAVTHITPPSANRPATPTKTFGSIATGQLEPGDHLLLATPALIHQVPLTRLQRVISQSSPNAAIAEITKLLQGASTDRVAALVIELTTPELAALQVRSEEPSEIHLGTPETPLEAAKMVATPLAQTTVASSKKFAQLAQTGLNYARPHARTISLAAVNQIRKLLTSKSGRIGALIGLILLVISIAGLVWYQNIGTDAANVFAKYQAVYADFQRGDQLMASGSKTNAREAFQTVQRDLSGLSPRERTINKQLEKGKLPENEPRSFSALSSLVSDRIDQIDGLVKTDAVTVVTFDAKNAKVTQFQLAGTNAYVFDAGNSNALSIINVATGTIKPSIANTTKLGNVINTTISGNNDGIYIITDKPSVWFYRFDNDTLTEQTIAFGQWPKATAISSYASNLYLLGETSVYKHTKNATGFSPKTDYLSIANSEEAKNSSGLAVDGSVYLLSPSGLHRYVSGVLKQSAPIPETIPESKDLRVGSAGDIIVASSSKSKRIGIWTLKGEALLFSKQIAPSNIKSLYGAAYDPKSGSVFALSDNRLVRISVRP